MEDEVSQRKKADVLDFTCAVERLANAVSILNTYYEICMFDYEDFWRIDSLIQSVVDQMDYVMEERKKVRDLFLD